MPVAESSDGSPATARPWSAIATRPAHSGVARLVPPNWYPPPSQGVLAPKSYAEQIDTPVFGSATADTSGIVRLVVE